jgi:hypothetical protein
VLKNVAERLDLSAQRTEEGILRETYRPGIASLQWKAPCLACGVIEADDVDCKVCRHGLDDAREALYLLCNVKQETP